MHFVFLVNEIFKMICASIAESDRGRADLVALACTCTSLEGISLDVLWGKRPMDFGNVLKSLPPDSWSYTKPSLSLNRPISLSELTRLRRYTTRVTDLHVHRGISTNAQTFQTLIGQHESFDWLSLWPRLKTLYWLTSSESLSFLKYFLTIDVRNLEVNLEGTDDEVFQEISALVESRCMNLEGLRLIGSETRGNKQIQDTIRQIIYNNSLTLRLFYPPLDPSAPLVSDILQLPVLRVLEMHIPQIPDHVPLDILPSLEHLTFTLDEPLDVIDLLGNLRDSRLRQFDLTCPYPTSRVVQVALANLFDDSGLYNSVDTFSWVPCPGGNGGTLTWEFIATLNPFINMQILTLATRCSRTCRFGFRHEHVVELSRWMPHLRELRFGGPPCAYGGFMTNVGYHTLAMLAKNCPNLSLLSIHFNINTFMYDSSIEPSRNVTCWDVGGTALPISPSSHTMIALAVSQLFPKTAFIGATARNARTWGVIYEELQMLTLPPILHQSLDLM